jgi:hypothetical protein
VPGSKNKIKYLFRKQGKRLLYFTVSNPHPMLNGAFF